MIDDKKSEPVTSRSRRQRALRLSIAGLLGLFLLLEVGLRVYHARSSREADIHPARLALDYSYELVIPNTQHRISNQRGTLKLVVHPFLVYKNLPNQASNFYNINSSGFRGREIDTAKGNDVYRIIVTGGSAAFGVGASQDSAAWPSLLEEKLNAYGGLPKRVEVINAGVIGFLTSQEAVYVQTELVDLKPDLIIAYNGYHDFFSAALRTSGCTRMLDKPQQIGYPAAFYELEGALITQISRKQRSPLEHFLSLFTYSELIRLLSGRAPIAQAPIDPIVGRAKTNVRSLTKEHASPTPEEDCADSIAHNFEENLRMIAIIAKSWGSDVALAVQPEISWKPSLSPEEERQREEMLAAYPWYDAGRAAVYPRLQAAAQRVASDLNLAILDLHLVFGSIAGTLFTDTVHLNDMGSDIIAGAMSDSLIPRIVYGQR